MVVCHAQQPAHMNQSNFCGSLDSCRALSSAPYKSMPAPETGSESATENGGFFEDDDAGNDDDHLWQKKETERQPHHYHNFKTFQT